MRRTLFGIAAVVTGLAAAAPAVRACGYGMPSPLARFALADCVVVGKVVEFEDRTVAAFRYPGAAEKSEYVVAVLKVAESLKGADGLTHLRVGLVHPQTLHVGQEACFFLAEHPDEAFHHTTSAYEYPINKENNEGFDKEVDQYRRWGKLLRDPVASLKSKDAAERSHTAALLITRYRTPVRGGKAKTELIDAVESRLILEALAGSDWGRPAPDFRITPQRLFNQLGMTAKDGWQPTGFKDAKEFEDAAKKWLRESAATFRIAALVRG